MSEPTPRKKTKSAIVGSDPISQLYRASHAKLLGQMKYSRTYALLMDIDEATTQEWDAAIATAERIAKHV